ncbi:hypothetical protein GCM10011504_07850 [Siccirubricoccus deserti]|nr:hypothetical protein GCM10011504_07850 [Siccirubricoccus deserti]
MLLEDNGTTTDTIIVFSQAFRPGDLPRGRGLAARTMGDAAARPVECEDPPPRWLRWFDVASLAAAQQRPARRGAVGFGQCRRAAARRPHGAPTHRSAAEWAGCSTSASNPPARAAFREDIFKYGYARTNRHERNRKPERNAVQGRAQQCPAAEAVKNSCSNGRNENSHFVIKIRTSGNKKQKYDQSDRKNSV